MNQVIKRSIIAGASLALLASPAAVLAHGTVHGTEEDEVKAVTMSPPPEPSEAPKSVDVSQLENSLRYRLESKREQRLAKSENENENKAEKLEGAKKKACEKHAETINRLRTVMDKRRTNTLSRITEIADAVEAFKDKKNLNVENYDELVAKVSAARTVAESATKDQQQVPSLNCSGDRPRADVSEFKDKRATSIDAVKEYRDAVKELIKAVKKAVSEMKETSPSPSPETDGGNQ